MIKPYSADTKMYEVFGDPSLNEMLLTAPIETLRKVFKLADEAVGRLQYEVDDNRICELCFNGRPNVMGVDRVYVIDSDIPWELRKPAIARAKQMVSERRTR